MKVNKDVESNSLIIVRCLLFVVEHLGVNQKGKRIKGYYSSIRDHTNEIGDSTSVEDFCILGNDSNELDLLLHESRLIEYRSDDVIKIYF